MNRKPREKIILNTKEDALLKRDDVLIELGLRLGNLNSKTPQFELKRSLLKYKINCWGEGKVKLHYSKQYLEKENRHYMVYTVPSYEYKFIPLEISFDNYIEFITNEV